MSETRRVHKLGNDGRRKHIVRFDRVRGMWVSLCREFIWQRHPLKENVPVCKNCLRLIERQIAAREKEQG